MKLYAGTSGYSYSEWKGSFYPEKLPAAKMLAFYAERLPAVEINNTFYRLPKIELLESWAAQVPPGFRFAIKAARRITHIKRLQDAAEETTYLLDTLRALGERLGVVLFQLPPYLRKDVARLEAFVQLLPPGTRAAFEFRHPSWLGDDVLACLHARELALCVADTDEGPVDTIASTAPWGYVRLRRAQYSDAELRAWVERLHHARWEQAFVFFKHEDAAAGPRLAGRFLELAPHPGPLPEGERVK